MRYYVLTDKGMHTVNEDKYVIETCEPYLLLAVADGVGGLENAKYASNMAINLLVKEFHKQHTLNLQETLKGINNALFEENNLTQGRMATTIVACLLHTITKECTIAHVGDSRAYIFNSDLWKTKDHTLVQELVELHIITEKEAFTHPEKNRLKQALGGAQGIDIDMHHTSLAQKRLLLCTDGLSGFIQDKDMHKMATHNSVKQAAKNLLKQAREHGSQDDITLILVEP
jgi:protein phosphatase